MTEAQAENRVLLTGSTGYIGGRLAPRLLEAGYRLRCLVRQVDKLRDCAWAHDARVEVVRADLTGEAPLAPLMRNCVAAYYLVHSMMSAGHAYAQADRIAAERFAQAAREAGVPRLIYLGGMGELGQGLSEHLSSRRAVETALASGGVPLTVFRAAMIIGSGSASFEILRYLVERLPIMLTPRWVRTQSQPIAVRNVLHYLIECLRVPQTMGLTMDIGGPDVLSYRELMHTMAELRGLPRRWIIAVPVLTPRLSSYWIHLVTPIPHRMARPLADGLRNPLICRDDLAQQLMPQTLLPVREAMRRALQLTHEHEVETVWSAAGVIPSDPDWAGGTVYRDQWSTIIQADAHRVYQAVCRVGGGHGYYAGDWLWRVRGAMDRLVGGPGLRRGRRDPAHVMLGEPLDFWRVTGLELDRELRLRAEMRLPGQAMLQFIIEPISTQQTRLTQRASFVPRGLMGLAYWWAVKPLHGYVFQGMLRGIARAAESLDQATM